MSKRQRARGFTLIELMVALALGMFIILALITLLINVNRSNSELAKGNRMIENARIALQLLDAEVSHAGFWGGYVPDYDDLSVSTAPTGVPSSAPDPCTANWSDAGYKNGILGLHVQAYQVSTPASALTVCSSKVTNPKAGTDVLFVRYVESGSCTPGSSGCPANTSDIHFQFPRCSTDTGNYLLGASAAASSAGTFTFKKRDCTTYADLWKFASSIFYVRDYSSSSSDGIPTLVRSKFNNGAYQAPEALVENVEAFRVEFGVDSLSDSGASVDLSAAVTWADTTNLKSPTNRGDGQADGAYVRCTGSTGCTVAQLMNAVTARLHVLVRAESPTAGYVDTKTYVLGSTTLGPFNDAYKRHAFTQTVRLNNVSMRRETP